ncbi:uncharacterized protein LOC110031473 [Phalaenopsis equestris]|uniref:uncharacterized protein LOC110031473 n=1 Tax=Phalaenopsis equestris TaxID=78828 RepID=UPI0009E4A1D6|nr:uncharacterized protein LOC110031473 [Phalaenopsis equestris]
MARMLQLVPLNDFDPSPLPLPLLLTLLAALFILAIFSLISALCASHYPKSRSRSPPPTSISSSEEHDAKVTVFPATHGPIGPTDPPTPTKHMTPRRKLSMSLSLKLPERLTCVRTGRKEAQEKEKTNSEDSTWMKAIILGGKCKVPENGEREDDEIIVYDENGNRQRIYHPRTPRSTPVSRTNSFIIPSSHVIV